MLYLIGLICQETGNGKNGNPLHIVRRSQPPMWYRGISCDRIERAPARGIPRELHLKMLARDGNLHEAVEKQRFACQTLGTV
jgi:hypothetical protein